MVDRRITVAFVLVSWLLLFDSTFQQQTGIEALSSRTERTALLELRASLGLRSRDWPKKADPCSLWNGVTCQNGSVVDINISGFRRTRIGSQNPLFAVDSLSNFSHLVSFNASNFLLPGSIPDWLGHKLLSLQVLDLSSCSIRGVIPVSLGNLTNLRSLNLSANSLTGFIPASLGQLSSLSMLDLSQNSLTGSLPPSFVSLENLSIFDLSSNFLAGSILPSIGALLKLQFLNLSNNNFSSSIPSQLGDLHSLVDLDLSFNSLSGSVPADLRGLRNLQRMVIGNNLLSGTLPVNLFPAQSQLQVVVVRQNIFTGEVPDVLWSIPGLHILDLSGNNFTGLLPNSGLNANVTAAQLNISQNKFYGNITPLLRKFKVVDLSGNYFQGTVPDFVLNNSSLGRNCLQNVSNQKTVTECASFYAEKGLTFDNFGRTNSSQPTAPKSSSGVSYRTIIIIATSVAGGVVLLLVCLVLFILCARKNGATSQRGVEVGPSPAGASPPLPATVINFAGVGDSLTYQQLLQATGDFNDANLIKHGHSGDLFRGTLESGIPIIIKRIDLQLIKRDAYLSELDFFSRASHPRLIPFLGHCLENEDQKFLVYKCMPNADLSSSLYRKCSSEEDGLQSLDWITRLKIAIGAAEGLSYMHHECSPPFVHRDVQASSILLDDKFEVRLGSLSEVCTQEGDPHQNRITRLLRLPKSSEQVASGSASAATCAYDVYCFGKVLLELVTGKLGMSASSDSQVKEWVDQTLPYISIYDKELVTKILDPSLIVDEDLLEEVWAMAIIARSCLNPKPSRRPLMRYILKALENPLKVVREDNSGSARLKTTSSRSSWNAALFGSWRHSSSDVAVNLAGSMTRAEGGSSIKQSGTTGSQGSGGQNGGGEHSSRRRQSREIFPEPSSEGQDIERHYQE